MTVSTSHNYAPQYSSERPLRRLPSPSRLRLLTITDLAGYGFREAMDLYPCSLDDGCPDCEERAALGAGADLLAEAYRAVDEADTDEEALDVLLDGIRRLADVTFERTAR